MNIKELSAIVDKKLAQLERQLAELHQKLKFAPDDEQIARDITSLEHLKSKLIKSRDLAWQAHQLQRSSDSRLIEQKRWIGLSILVFSGLGLVILAIAFFML